MVLYFASHHPEGGVARGVVYVQSAEARGEDGWNPFLIGIVLHHDSGPRLTDTLFTAERRRRRERKRDTLTSSSTQGDIGFYLKQSSKNELPLQMIRVNQAWPSQQHSWSPESQEVIQWLSGREMVLEKSFM